MKNLAVQAFAKAGAGLLLCGLLLFGPAGTLHWAGAWRFLAVLFLPMVAVGVVLLCKAPELLKKRLNAKEEQATQRGVILVSALLFVADFVLCGLDYRFGWSALPGWLEWAAMAAFLLGYALYGEVLRENAWLSRTVEVQQGQRVVDTGLYGAVRHPMYAATVLLFLSMPLILGSLWGFVLLLAYPAVLVPRVLNEEKVLKEGLPGYEAYMQKVRWRLIPFVW